MITAWPSGRILHFPARTVVYAVYSSWNASVFWKSYKCLKACFKNHIPNVGYSNLLLNRREFSFKFSHTLVLLLSCHVIPSSCIIAIMYLCLPMHGQDCEFSKGGDYAFVSSSSTGAAHRPCIWQIVFLSRKSPAIVNVTRKVWVTSM